MIILIVDNCLDRLHELEQLVGEAFPNDEVHAYQDPLMAGKYSYFNHVDILVAELCMKRMDGLKMSGFVRMTNPGAEVYLIGSQIEFDESIILGEDKIDGQLVRPVTLAALRRAAQEGPRKIRRLPRRKAALEDSNHAIGR